MTAQRVLFARSLSLDEIVRTVDEWTPQRRYEFWERVGIVSRGMFDNVSVRCVFEKYREGL